MAINPVFGNVRINEKTDMAAEKIHIECKTEIPSDTVSRILDVSAFCGGAEYSADSGEVFGTVIFNVIYLNTEGIVKKYECAQEFSEKISEDVSGKTYIPKTIVEKATADVSGTRLTVHAGAAICGKIFNDKEYSYLTGESDVVLESEEKAVAKSFGVKKATFPVEEEIELPYEVAEVLSQRAQAVITEVQCGVGTIIIDGETVATALLLQNSENGDIIKEEKIIPFRFELQCDETMPANVATADVSVKSIRSDISVDSESGISTANVLIALNVSGEAFSEETVSLAADAYSETDITVLSFSQAKYRVPCGVKVIKRSVTGRCGAGIPAGASICAVTDEIFETVSLSTDKGISVKGVFSAKAVYKDGDGKTGTVTLETPVELFEEKGEWDSAELCIMISGGKVRPISETESEISGEITVSAALSKAKKLEFISGIESTGIKPACDAAISVYIPLEGESLFSLAKRLSVRPEKLIETNKELNFPLTGKERIVIYRQK